MTKLLIGTPLLLTSAPALQYNITGALMLFVLGMGMILMYVVNK